MESVNDITPRFFHNWEDLEAWQAEQDAARPSEPEPQPLPATIEDASRMESPLNPVCCGLDIGQINDNSVLVVCEAIRVWRGKRTLKQQRPAFHDMMGHYHQAEEQYEKSWETLYAVRLIERFALGTSFPDIAIRVADILGNDELRPRQRRLLVDRTGYGLPVYQMILAEMENRTETRDVTLKPVVFGSGDDYDEHKLDPRMGTGYEVSRLNALFQRGLVEIPDTALGHMLLEELNVHERKKTETGRSTYGAASGKHDDMMTALALACAEDPYRDEVSTFPLPASWK